MKATATGVRFHPAKPAPPLCKDEHCPIWGRNTQRSGAILSQLYPKGAWIKGLAHGRNRLSMSGDNTFVGSACGKGPLRPGPAKQARINGPWRDDFEMPQYREEDRIGC
jgi:hypothetical protein